MDLGGALRYSTGFGHLNTREAPMLCYAMSDSLRSESEMERNPEVPSSTRDEALLYYTTPSGVPRGPAKSTAQATSKGASEKSGTLWIWEGPFVTQLGLVQSKREIGRASCRERV